MRKKIFPFILFLFIYSFFTFFLSCSIGRFSKKQDITLAISWIGIRSIELSIKNKTTKTKDIGVIIRKANDSIPLYKDIKNKPGFLKRTILANKTKKIFTAMQYDTDLQSLDESDSLLPNTSYKIYLFNIKKNNSKKPLKIIPFTTKKLPIPSEIKTNTPKFLETFPNSDNILHIKKNDPILFPVITQLGNNTNIILEVKTAPSSTHTIAIRCSSTSCLFPQKKTDKYDGLPLQQDIKNRNITYSQFIFKIASLYSNTTETISLGIERTLGTSYFSFTIIID